jgi:hypothetical protein
MCVCVRALGPCVCASIRSSQNSGSDFRALDTQLEVLESEMSADKKSTLRNQLDLSYAPIVFRFENYSYPVSATDLMRITCFHADSFFFLLLLLPPFFAIRHA